MKRIAFALLLPVLFQVISPRQLTSAASSGPGVSGSFQFSTDGRQISNIDFNVAQHLDGNTFGEMTYAQDLPVSDKSSHHEDQPDAPSRLVLKAQFDCLVIKNNKAVMSGTVSEANISSYIGRRVLLVVEDNSHDTSGRKQDRLTWGLYRISKSDWLPSDSERSDEQSGATPTWLAQDAERTDDAGTLSNQSNIIGCQSYPLSAFTFIDEKQGHGKIHVTP
jgi:hypothetical protein